MKNIITTVALLAAGTALANATPVAEKDMFSSEYSWTTGAGRSGRNTFSINTSNKTCTLENSNWSQAYAYHQFSAPLTIDAGETLNFSFYMNVNHLSGSFTFTLQSDNLSIAMGKNYDETSFRYGKTDNVSNSVYQFKENSSGQMGKISSSQTVSNFTLSQGSMFKVSGQISAPSSTSENYTLKLTVGGEESSFDLGTASFSLKKVGFFGDGDKNVGTNVTFSDLKVSVIPEPSAFGLLAGLGALALVGARRRRRK